MPALVIQANDTIALLHGCLRETSPFRARRKGDESAIAKFRLWEDVKVGTY
jgi:hypothetical protein